MTTMTKLKCPHCGKLFHPHRCRPLTPKHSTAGVACPGSEQQPRNAETDRRPLWKDDPGMVLADPPGGEG